jgi:hypothetical protein
LFRGFLVRIRGVGATAGHQGVTSARIGNPDMRLDCVGRGFSPESSPAVYARIAMF